MLRQAQPGTTRGLQLVPAVKPLLFRVLAQQPLVQALRLLLRIPLTGQPGMAGTQRARGQFLDAHGRAPSATQAQRAGVRHRLE